MLRARLISDWHYISRVMTQNEITVSLFLQFIARNPLERKSWRRLCRILANNILKHSRHHTNRNLPDLETENPRTRVNILILAMCVVQ